jgi:L-fuconolactonase
LDRAPEVQPALAALPQLGLQFDALVKPRELKALLRTLEHHPDLGVVIDHCAKPDIAANRWQPWAKDLAALARHPRAHCKLSGLVTEAGVNWSVEALRRYTDHVFQCFGPTRLLWGSDWPVVTLAASYAAWVAASETLLAGVSRADKERIFGANARRFYGLGE